MEKETQNSLILDYLKSGKPIDDTIARDLCGSRRLSARIYDLRHKQGFDNIKTKSVVSKNRFGRTCTYAVYYMEGASNG